MKILAIDTYPCVAGPGDLRVVAAPRKVKLRQKIVKNDHLLNEYYPNVEDTI